MKFTNPGQRSDIPSPCHYPLLKNCKLSSKELSGEQIKFLWRGLKFTPTPRKNVCKVINADIQFLYNSGERGIQLFRHRKAWRKRKVTPPRNRNITLENYVDFLSKFLLEELQVIDTSYAILCLYYYPQRFCNFHM